jgi:drug/metabolite transporter (DMT)-like permease
MEREYWFVAAGAALYGTLTVGAKIFADMGLSLYEISVYPLLIISIALLPIILARREYMIKKSMLPFFVIYGLIGGLIQLAQFAGIILGVPVAVVALLLLHPACMDGSPQQNHGQGTNHKVEDSRSLHSSSGNSTAC